MKICGVEGRGFSMIPTKMDCWGNEVNVFLDMERNAVVITSKMIFASLHIAVNMVLGPQQRLCFLNCNISL